MSLRFIFDGGRYTECGYSLAEGKLIQEGRSSISERINQTREVICGDPRSDRVVPVIKAIRKESDSLDLSGYLESPKAAAASKLELILSTILLVFGERRTKNAFR